MLQPAAESRIREAPPAPRLSWNGAKLAAAVTRPRANPCRRFHKPLCAPEQLSGLGPAFRKQSIRCGQFPSAPRQRRAAELPLGGLLDGEDVIRVIRPCHPVMVPGPRLEFAQGSRGRAGTLVSCSSPHLRSPGAGTSSTSCKCMPPVPAAPPCCDGGRAEQGEGPSPSESPTRCWGTEGWSGRNRLLPHSPCSPPSCLSLDLPMGCRVATSASHHTAGSLLAREGSVHRDGEPELCGVRGAGNLLWCVPAPAEPKQETTAAGDCCGHSRGSASPAALPWPHQPCTTSSW